MMHILFQVVLEVLSTPMPIRGIRISPSYINFLLIDLSLS